MHDSKYPIDIYSYTTVYLFSLDTCRQPRDGEIHGKGYYFTDRETMEIDIKEDAFLEYGEFNGNLYGTKLETIENVIRSGKMCVLDVNPTVCIVFFFIPFHKIVVEYYIFTVCLAVCHSFIRIFISG